MAIKRNKVDRIAVRNVREPTVSPHNYGDTMELLCSDKKKLLIDFSTWGNTSLPEIKAQFRDALWSMQNSSTTTSLTSYFAAINRFLNFLSDAENGPAVLRLDQIDRDCVDRFLAWLELQIVSKGQKNSGRPLSVSLRRQIYCGLKAVLVNRQIYNSELTSKSLTFPRNPFPNANRLHGGRSPYSDEEYRQILAALKHDLNTISDRPTSLPSLQVLVVYLLALASATGANLQPLLELRLDHLKSHPMDDRETLTLFKRRGWTTLSTSVRKSAGNCTPDARQHTVSKSVGDYIRDLAFFTRDLDTKAPREFSGFLFLWQVPRGVRKGEVFHLTRYEAKTGLRDFSRRHRLKTDSGAALILSFGRFRPTYATQLYSRNGDLRAVSRALGHSNIDTTVRSYISLPTEAVRDHAIVAEEMVRTIVRAQHNGRTAAVAGDGVEPKKGVKNLLAEGYPTGIAHCSNPFRAEDDVCKKFFTCFRCPNLVILEDDLWRLFSFYYRILGERNKLSSKHWMKTYAPIIRKIDHEITPLFDSDKVLRAKHEARSNPHPAWR